jgi:peptidoglycan-associated lipoprotein
MRGLIFQKLIYLVVVFMAVNFAGCSSKGGEKPATEADSAATSTRSVTTEKGASTGVDDNANVDGSNLGSNESVSMPSQNIVYFDYDKSDIKAEFKSVLEEHAAYLAANPNVHVRLEGHADERGSREYNLALGENRANATKRTLGILGISESRFTILSYGEEKPTKLGHDEGSWQYNRRVEIIYP